MRGVSAAQSTVIKLPQEIRRHISRVFDLGKLSDKQAEVFNQVVAWIVTNGCTPTYRNLEDTLGYSSPNSVAIHIAKLRSKGFIKSDAILKQSMAPDGVLWIPVPKQDAEDLCVTFSSLMAQAPGSSSARYRERTKLITTAASGQATGSSLTGSAGSSGVLKTSGNSASRGDKSSQMSR